MWSEGAGNSGSVTRRGKGIYAVQCVQTGSGNYAQLHNTWERKVLRKIFGPICVAGYWRSRTNEEVRQLYGELDIVTEIKRKIEMAGTCGEDE